MNLIEATMNALQGKLEARNPENDEINSKITKTLNGSVKYKDDLKDAGLETIENEKGKVDAIRNPKKQSDGGYKGINKQDIKNSNPDTDYYNYLMKDRIAPEVTDTGAFEPMNAFRNSDNFEKMASKDIYGSEDRNGVSNAIPKRYKTGRKNYGYNPDEFPRKDYNGVASYEPLSNKELNDFKHAKSTTSDGGWRKAELDQAESLYKQAKAEYDKEYNKVKNIRDRIAMSKSKRKEEARSHKEDNEKAAPRDEFNKAPRYIKNSPYNEIDVPKRAIIHSSEKPNEDGVVWGVVDKDLIDTYEQSTPDIERYKEYKADAERERDNAKYYNALAKQSDDRASDIVRDRKLDRAKRNLQGKQIFNVKDEKKTESVEDTDAKNIESIKEILNQSGIKNENTLDLMSKDILKDLKRNYTKGCKDSSGLYYGVVITDAIQKKIQQITGKQVKVKECKEIKEEKLGNNRKVRKVIGSKKQEGRFNPNSENPEIRMKNYKLMLKRALGTDYEVVGKQGYRYYSGFVKNNKNGKCAYYSINQDWNGKDETDNILIRTAKDFKDYTGGTNQYTDIDNFVKDISRLVESTSLNEK